MNKHKPTTNSKLYRYPVYLAFQTAPTIINEHYSANQRSVKAIRKTTNDGMYPQLYAETLCTESQKPLDEYHDFMEQLCTCDPTRAISLHAKVLEEMQARGTSRSNLMQVAQLLQRKGRNGDTVLAHISPAEAQHLKDHGGSGTRNPDTGLMEFWLEQNEGTEKQRIAQRDNIRHEEAKTREQAKVKTEQQRQSRIETERFEREVKRKTEEEQQRQAKIEVERFKRKGKRKEADEKNY